jgi:hypothetical protein
MIPRFVSIPGASRYTISDRGVVVSLVTRGGPRELSQFDRKLMNGNPSGYLSVNLTHDDGTRRNRYVHELVLIAFVGPRPSEKHEVLHGDGCRANNWLYNLRWGTVKENAADRERHRLEKRDDNWYRDRGLPPPWVTDDAQDEIELPQDDPTRGAFDDLLGAP